MFDFRACFFFFLARILTGFLKLTVQFNSFYLLQLLFPEATVQQTGRASSLFLNNARNWGWGKRENQMFCYIAVYYCSRNLGTFVILCFFQ